MTLEKKELLDRPQGMIPLRSRAPHRGRQNGWMTQAKVDIRHATVSVLCSIGFSNGSKNLATFPDAQAIAQYEVDAIVEAGSRNTTQNRTLHKINQLRTKLSHRERARRSSFGESRGTDTLVDQMKV